MDKNDFIDKKINTALHIIAFLAVPFTTYFIMLGGVMNFWARTVAFGASVLLFLMTGFVFFLSNRNKALIIMVFFLILITLARCLPEYTYNNKNSKALIEACESKERAFSGYIIKGDATVSSGMYVSIHSVDGFTLKKPVNAYCYNQSGNFYSEGAYVEMSARIRKPVSNPGAFDFAGWLFSEGIYCELYNISEIKADYTKDKISIGSYLRDKIYINAFKMLKNIYGKDSFEKGTALAKALLTGDKSGFSSESLEWFSRSGMTHLLCVSGLHFTIMLGGLSALIRPLIRNRKARKLILFIISVLYLCVCGFSKSAMRSAVMAFIGSSVFGAGSKTISKLLMAVSVICLIDPTAIRDTGFHLSVLSCGGIACSSYITEVINKKFEFGVLESTAFEVFAMSLGAFAFTFAYSACAFDSISTVSVATSVLSVVPAQICLIVLWVSVILGIANADSLLVLCTGIYNTLSGYIYNVARVFSGFRYSSLNTSVPNVSLYIFMIMLTAMAFTTFSKVRASKIYFYALIISVVSVTVLIQFS